MKSQTEEQKTTEMKKPRFKIEKLEERIAPHHRVGHYKGGGSSGDNGCFSRHKPNCGR